MAIRERFCVIFNPVAGKGRTRAHREDILNAMDADGLDYALFETGGPLHATELARSAGLKGFTVVVAVGGDGTVNEVVNGLMAAHNEGDPVPTLAILPLGRGNDFSAGACIPSALSMAISFLSAGVRQPLDVGRIRAGDYPEGKHFINGIGIGFDTIVGLHAARMKHAPGALGYLFGALKTFVQYPEAPEVTIAWEGGSVHQRAHQISIMNGKRMGGLFWMAPEASVHDGLFDACFTRDLKRWPMLTGILAYIRKTQFSRDDFSGARSPWFTIEAPAGGLVVHADGETICTDGKSLAIECISRCLDIITCPLDISG